MRFKKHNGHINWFLDMFYIISHFKNILFLLHIAYTQMQSLISLDEYNEGMFQNRLADAS